MKKVDFLTKALLATSLFLTLGFVRASAQDQDSTTWCDFETMTNDTVFKDLGELETLPLNWVFNTKDPNGTDHLPAMGAAPVLVDGYAGQAMEFDGSSYWMLLQKPYDAKDPFATPREQFSLSVWFNAERTTVNPPKKPEQFIVQIGSHNGVALMLRNDSLWAAASTRDHSKTYQNGAIFTGLVVVPFTTTDEWVNVVMTFNGKAVNDTASLFSVYLNGELIGVDTVTSPMFFQDIYGASAVGGQFKWNALSNALSIEKYPDVSYVTEGDVDCYFKGKIDELKTWKRALSKWDVKNIVYENKENYVYTFDDQADGDSIVLDSGDGIPYNVSFKKGNAEDSPLGHMTLSDDNQGGKALTLNGSDEYILVQGKYENYPEGAEPFGLKMTELSATAWINPVATHTNPPKSPSQTIIKIGHANGIALDLRNDTLWAAVAARDRYEGSDFIKNLVIGAPFTAAGEWSLVGVSFKGDAATGTGELSLYINGEQVASAEFDTCVLFRSAFTNATIGAYMSWGPFFDDIGYLDDHVAGHFFKGALGEVKISKEAIDPNNMRKDYLLSLNVPEVYYDFEKQQDGDSILVDSCGNWNAMMFNSHLTHDEANAANPLVLPELGTATFGEGLQGGKALVFDGSSDWMLIQNKYDGYYPDGVPPFGDAYEDLTARVWINPEMTTVAPPKSPDQFIVHVGHSNGVAMMLKNDTLWAGAAVRNRAGGNDPMDNVILKTPFDKVNQWSQVAVVFDGKSVNDTASRVTLYVNGEAVDSAVLDGDMIYSSYFNSTVVGAEYSYNPLGSVALWTADGEVTSYFKGMMDNVLITKKALTKEDMAADYQENAPTLVPVRQVENVKVYPNPTTGVLYLDLKTLQGTATVDIVDMTGTVVLSRKLGESELLNRMDLSGLTNGFYIVRVVSEDSVYLAKVQLLR